MPRRAKSSAPGCSAAGRLARCSTCASAPAPPAARGSPRAAPISSRSRNGSAARLSRSTTAPRRWRKCSPPPCASARPATFHLLAFGGAGHRPTPRDAQFLELLHRELLPLLGTPLATPADLSLHGLSPRRREIFDLACTGLAEKAIADRLGLRASTVNESLQTIYAHFGVRTRPQFMAYLLQRCPRPASLINSAAKLDTAIKIMNAVGRTDAQGNPLPGEHWQRPSNQPATSCKSPDT